MAKFTVERALLMAYHGHDLNGPPGTVHRIPDSLVPSFLREYGEQMPGIAWIEQDEATSGGGAHPDLAAHETLGLITQAAVTAHAALADPHALYALDADLAGHEVAGHIHSHAESSITNLVADLAGKAASSHSHVDGDLPASIARDTEVTSAVSAHEAAADPHTGYRLESAAIAHGDLASVTADQHHARQHSITSASDHSFPGGTTFLRADGAFAAPPGGSEAFPVGSVFIAVVATNPASLLGYGTWAAFAAGRMLVGLDAGDTSFDVVEETGGAKTHTHADHTGVINHTHPVTDPGHTHLTQRYPTATGGSSGFTIDTSMSGTLADNTLPTKSATTGVTTTNPAGGVAALAHDAPSSLPPYVVVYMWKRTA